jgi:rhodanese-related sulfurtransferase
LDTVSLTPIALHSPLGSARAPLILDVRREAAFAAETRIIAGALRPQGDLVAFAREHGAGRPVVVYCVRGHEVGQDAARLLSAAGQDARFLEEGLEGWIAAGLPTIRRKPEWGIPGASRWITRERPKIDRVACPWLVRRFIDPAARFDYVPAAAVLSEASARGAIPYDVPGVAITHRGERCSFDALLEDFALRDPALEHLARIVRGADTNRLDLAPQCAGLLAASLGLSRRHDDDHAMLAEAMTLYDSLYAWCRAEAQGDAEGHAWTSPS